MEKHALRTYDIHLVSKNFGKKLTPAELYESIVECLEKAEKTHAERKHEALTRLMTNISHRFSWDAKDLFMNDYYERSFTRLMTNIGNTEYAHRNLSTLLEMFKLGVEMKTDFIMQPFNIRSKSTCEVSTMTSTWEYECQLELLKVQKKIMEIIETALKHYEEVEA